MAPSEAWTVTAAVHQPAELAPIPVLPEPAAAEAAEAADGEADAAAESARRSESLRDRETFRAELQLPPGLPDRVYALADALTAGLTGDAERAQAIESFLQENYTYRMDVPKLPKTAADFADTFLFETKEGYCDYFSTSMAVLLRAAGIPARWVKGFTSGQVTGTGAGGMLDVTVLNRNAHSWVEAYIPGSGWTVFDPTPAGPDSAPAESAAAVQASALPSAAGAADGDAPLLQRLQQRMAEAGQWLSGFGRQGAGGSDTLSAGMKWTAAALIALLLPLLITLVRIVRRSPSIQLGPGYPSAGAYTSRRASSFRPFDKLWIKLFGRLGRKKPEHTVREYVESLPLSEVGQREALLDFVKQYEAVRYGAAPVPRTTARGLKELWRRITRGAE
jgi:transglutaminase-like putative cysteine protease